MNVIIGPFTLTGTAAQNLSIQATMEAMALVLGARVQPSTVAFRAASQMPRRSDGGPSYGFWKNRTITLWDEVGEYNAGKTAAHEAIHQLDQDWFTKQQRLDICALETPRPTGWRDTLINGKPKPYVALPFEVAAVYGSAALGGFDKPAYRSLYLRTIPASKWPTLKDVMLKDYGHAEPDPGDPPPTPPDPAQLEIARLTAQLAVAGTKAQEIVELAKETP